MGYILSFKLIISFLQMETAKQDDALSNISNVLGELKEMAIDMGSAMDRLVVLIQLPFKSRSFLCLFDPIMPFTYQNRSKYITHDYCSQNKALEHFHGDVDVIDMRVKDANRRGRRLLGK